MSDGATHDKHGMAFTFACFVMAVFIWAATDVVASFLLPLGSLFGTFFLSPDLDMAHTDPFRRWGPFRFLWRPYAALHKHRGVSHHPLIGPAGRLLYLGVLAAPVYLLVSGPVLPPAESYHPLLYAATGVVLANWVHLLGDIRT